MPLSLRSLRDHCQTAVARAIGVAYFGLEITDIHLGIGTYPPPPLRYKNRRRLYIEILALLLDKSTTEVSDRIKDGKLADVLIQRTKDIANGADSKMVRDPKAVRT